MPTDRNVRAMEAMIAADQTCRVTDDGCGALRRCSRNSHGCGGAGRRPSVQGEEAGVDRLSRFPHTGAARARVLTGSRVEQPAVSGQLPWGRASRRPGRRSRRTDRRHAAVSRRRPVGVHGDTRRRRVRRGSYWTHRRRAGELSRACRAQSGDRCPGQGRCDRPTLAREPVGTPPLCGDGDFGGLGRVDRADSAPCRRIHFGP